MAEPVPAKLAAKLQKILAAVGTVEKKGHNRAQNYDFVRETDLVDKVRPLMAELGVFLNLDVVDHEIREGNTTSSGSKMFLTIIKVAGTWIDTQTGDVWNIPSHFIGYGADTGDKGAYKAMTGAEKYFLFKSFLVSSGDDPEADERTDRQTAAPGSTPRVAARQRSEGQQRGGRSSVPTAAQIGELRRLAGEAHMDAGLLLAFIEKTIRISTAHVDATVRSDVLNFIQGLSAQQIGILIRTLAEATSAPAAADPENPVEEVDIEGLKEGVQAAIRGEYLPD